MTRLWVDVGDLFTYAGTFQRPSGIQRVVFELGRALACAPRAGAQGEENAGEANEGAANVGFVRRGNGNRFVPVAWSSIATLFAGLADAAAIPVAAPASSAWHRAALLQTEALRALAAVPRSLRPWRDPTPDIAAGDSGPSAMRPGDRLLVAGAGWADPDHVARVTAAHRTAGVRVALLVHDIIPLRRPEWFDPAGTERFRQWLDGMLGVADRLLAVSASTADDLRAYRSRAGAPDAEVRVIRLGDGFTPAGPGASPPPAAPHIAGPYVLFVSTMEARKNHALLVDVWRILLDRLPAEMVPRLVFAGREGALTADLMRQLRASDCLGGKIVLCHALGDAEIATLYRGCAFTLFPSLYEGWGLPVAESLAFGRPCLASSSSSIPEVGGTLARYFDPMDTRAAAAAVEAVLLDPDGLAAWQQEVARSFQPTPWSVTAAMVRAGID